MKTLHYFKREAEGDMDNEHVLFLNSQALDSARR